MTEKLHRDQIRIAGFLRQCQGGILHRFEVSNISYIRIFLKKFINTFDFCQVGYLPLKDKFIQKNVFLIGKTVSIECPIPEKRNVFKILNSDGFEQISNRISQSDMKSKFSLGKL